MKNSAVLILLAAAVALGGLYLRERHKTREADALSASLQRNVAELEARLAQQQARATRLQTRLKDTREKVVTKAEEVTHLQQAITNRVEAEAKEKNPLAEMFKNVGEMFKNPEMKEFVKNQQKTALSGIIDKGYGPFFSNGSGLTPEQSSAVKELIIKRSLADAETGLSMMTGEMNETERDQAVQHTKEQQDAIDEQIKQILGDEQYGQFTNYQKSVPERMVVGMFKDQQAAGPAALTEDQEAQLLGSMYEERQNFKFTTDFSDQSKLASGLAGNFTEEKMNQFLQEQEQLHQRYLGRAQNILSGDQYGAYEKFLSAQRQMQSLGLKMASKMFAPKQGGN